MLIPISYTRQTAIAYLPRIKKSSHFLYLFLTLGIIAILTSLPLLYTDISARSTGIIRPMGERTEVKPVISGIIDKIFFKEGDTVSRNAIIISLKDPGTKSKTLLNNYEISQRQSFITDLEILCSTNFSSANINFADFVNKLSSPLYKDQLTRFFHQKTEQDILLKKAIKTEEMNSSLAKEKIISPKEFFDIQMQRQQQSSVAKALVQEQLSNWQQDLSKYKLELSQYQQQTNQIETDASYYEIKAPINGVIQGINNRYTGGYLQTNETICSISPSGNVIAECYVSATDIGLIKLKQQARFQIDAFDYNYFGVMTGRVQSIDNDYTIVDNKPVFKVRCRFDTTQLRLKNGFTGELKKGLTFQCRFMVARRNLWQLLWDKVDDWLNPSSPIKTSE